MTSDHDFPTESGSSSQTSGQSSGQSSKPGLPTRDFDQFSKAASGLGLPMWSKAILVLAAVILAGVGFIQSSFWHKADNSKPVLAELDPNELAQRPIVKDFTITDDSGKAVKFSSFKGQVVILSFWASWCTPCLMELPTFADLQKKFEKRGFKVITVNIDDGEEGKKFAKDFWNKNQFPFASFFDPSKLASQQFEVEMLPSNFVIDRQGRQVFSSFGSNDWSTQTTMDTIEGLLQETDHDPTPDAGA